MTLVAVPDDELARRIDRSGLGVSTLVWDWRHQAAPAAGSAVHVLVSDWSARPPEPALLATLSGLQLVQLCSAGYEGWQVPAGVRMCTGRGIHGQSTAEAAVAGVLALLRRLPDALRAQRNEQSPSLPVQVLSGCRVTVVGAGDIGQRLVDIFAAFGCPVVQVARSARGAVRSVTDLSAIVPATDVLVLAVPLTPQTRGLVGEALLTGLPTQAVVVNVSRGPVVDTAALTAQVLAGRLRAVLDVTDPEPLPAGHPLWRAPGALLTPHTGGAAADWRDRFADLVLEQLRRLTVGEQLLNLVS